MNPSLSNLSGDVNISSSLTPNTKQQKYFKEALAGGSKNILNAAKFIMDSKFDNDGEKKNLSLPLLVPWTCTFLQIRI